MQKGKVGGAVRRTFGGIRESFVGNINSVKDLVSFDEVIQHFCIQALEKANTFLEKQGLDKHPSCSVGQMLKQVKTIRSHESLKPQYRVILNQAVVLLVSYFGSAMQELFATAVSFRVKGQELGKLEVEDLKLTIGEIKGRNFDLSDSIGELIAIKKDISFQDMQSIGRGFRDYLEFEPEQDRDVNNIIMGQACRHAIVHSGGTVDSKMIKQTARAKPRDLKESISSKEELEFTNDEITILGASMLSYFDRVAKGVGERLTRQGIMN